MATTEYPRYKQIGRTRFVERAPGLGWTCIGVENDAHSTRNSTDDRQATQGSLGPVGSLSPELEEPGDGSGDAVDSVGVGNSAPEAPRAVRQPDANAIYHADTVAVGQSMLKVFAKDRRRYRAMELGEIDPSEAKKGVNDSLNVGNATHGCLLDDRELSQYHVPPDSVLPENGHRRGKRWDAWCESVGGPEWTLKADQMDMVQAMAASVRAKIGDLLEMESVAIEQPIRWVHEPSGLICKAKPDLLIVGDGWAQIWDIKTVTPDAVFERQALKMGYDIQDVHYCEGVQSVTGVDEVQFLMIAVVKQAPYTSAVYEFSEKRKAEAAERRERLLQELAECRRTGDWTNPREREITRIW